MKTIKYKCIISDIDGTLLRSDKTLSEETRSVLETLMEQGIHFVPATGRAIQSLPDPILSLRGLRYVVTSNGVAVFDVENRQTVCQVYLPSDFVVELLKFLKNESIIYECFIDGRPYIGQTDYDSWGIRGGNPKRKQYITATRTPVNDIQAYILENKDRMDCIDLTLDPDVRDRVIDAIKRNLPEVYITTSDNDLIEISHRDSGKHIGIARICELFDISPDEIIAFGDNDNDIEMLKTAGLGIAVANSSSACLSASDEITLSNDEDGVAVMLKKLNSQFFL